MIEYDYDRIPILKNSECCVLSYDSEDRILYYATNKNGILEFRKSELIS